MITKLAKLNTGIGEVPYHNLSSRNKIPMAFLDRSQIARTNDRAPAARGKGFALLCRRDRFRTMWFDLAGSLTFIGVVLSVLIEPDQMVRLFTLSNQAE
jgi:hypothetical protein